MGVKHNDAMIILIYLFVYISNPVMATNLQNSSNSIVPFMSVSMSCNILQTSSSLIRCPKFFITSFSSFFVMCPSLSLSNLSKIALILAMSFSESFSACKEMYHILDYIKFLTISPFQIKDKKIVVYFEGVVVVLNSITNGIHDWLVTN